jgi:hypothetical protein
VSVSRRRTSRLIGLLSAVVLVAGLAAFVTPPATAAGLGTPSGLSPNGGVTDVNPILSWNAVGGATGYDVQVSTNPDYSNPVYDRFTVNTKATPPDQLPMTRLYWRVRARKDGDTGSWAGSTFDRNKLAGPALLAPASGVTLSQPGQPPLFRWNTVTGAVDYVVEVDTSASPDWVDAKSFTTRATSLVWSEFSQQDPGTYSWRVTAEIGQGQLTFPSASRSYTIGQLGAINVVSPAPDAVVEQVVLDWDALPGAVTYDVRISTDDSFNTIIDQRTVRGTRYSPPKTYDVDDYWWQVRPRNVFDKAPDWTSLPVRHFQRTWEGAGAVPVLQYPANQLAPQIGDDLYYQWTPSRLASRYRIDVSSTQNFSPNTFESCFTTQTVYVPGALNPPGGVNCVPNVGLPTYWRVKALDGSGSEIQGVYSSISKFVYNPGRVVLTGPADGATVDVPVLTWTPFVDAESYTVSISWNGGGTTANTFSTSYTPGFLDPTKGPFVWSVIAHDSQGTPSAIPINGQRSFNLTGNLPNTPAAPLVPLTPGPAATPTYRFPSLSWEPLAGATRYQVWVGTHDTNFFLALEGSPQFSAWTDDSQDFLAAGDYDWFVQAFDGSNNLIGQTSPANYGEFVIAEPDSVVGQRVALQSSTLLDDGAAGTKSVPQPGGCILPPQGGVVQVCHGLHDTPVFDWDPVEDVAFYILYISRDPNFQNMVFGQYSDPNSLPHTVNTRWSPTVALPDSQAGVAYYWFVRPCTSAISCAPDPTKATNAFDKTSSTVQGLQWAANAANDITFSWQDYLATNQNPANVTAATGEQSTQSAMSYRLQVSTNPSFTAIVDDITVDQTTYTAFDKNYPEGPLWWRVQVVDGSGNLLTQPATGSAFTKASPAPLLTGPSGPSPVTQAFEWQPAAFANAYTLEVYKDADTAASPANRVIQRGGIKQTAFANDQPLPTGTSYVWRVRRTDSSGNDGTWSAWGQFSVLGSMPQLASPAANARVPFRGALFQWTATPDAAAYRFERREVGSGGPQETVVTRQTAWAPLAALGTGNFQWRVISLDTSGNVIAATDWRGFTVDATPPTILKRKPEGSGVKPTSKFVLTFSEKVEGVSSKTIQLVFGKKKVVKAKVKLSKSGKKATIKPKKRLLRGKTYTLKIRDGITDTAGLPLPSSTYPISIP